MSLLPLDRRRRLPRQLIHNPTHVGDFRGDALRDVLQERPGEFNGAGDHEVVRLHGAKGDGVVVGANSVHDTDRLKSRHDGEVLRYEIGEAVLDDRIAEDGVGFAEDFELLARDAAEAADCKPRTGERLTVDESCGEPQGASDGADFFFEEYVERLDDADEVDVFRKSADVVVAFHDFAAASALNDVGVDRALCEIGRAAEFRCFLLKDADELFADDLAFALGIEDTFHALDEAVGRIDRDEANLERAGKHLANHLGFVFSHKPVIDENARQLVADGFVNQHGDDRGIDTAGETADNVAVSDLFADIGHGFFYKRFHRPVS